MAVYLSHSQVLRIFLDHLLDPTPSLAASQGKGLNYIAILLTRMSPLSNNLQRIVLCRAESRRRKHVCINLVPSKYRVVKTVGKLFTCYQLTNAVCEML